jgi:hypothetical protein
MTGRAEQARELLIQAIVLEKTLPYVAVLMTPSGAEHTYTVHSRHRVDVDTHYRRLDYAKSLDEMTLVELAQLCGAP